MRFDGTVFITDMDGTLLKSDKSVSEKNLKMIKEYQSQDGIFGLATGRPIHTTLRYLDILKPDLPLILYNGCIVYDHKSDKIVYGKYLPDEARDILKDVFAKYPGIAPEIFTFEAQYYLNLNEAEKWHHEILQVSYIKKNSGDEITEPWCKLLLADSESVINELSEYVKKFDGMGVRFVRSCPYFLEILPDGISKGTAVSEMRKALKLDDKLLVSAGDYDNDIEMLKASDISFCPADSQPEVKKAAKYVLSATCNEDAIAEAIEALSKI